MFKFGKKSDSSLTNENLYKLIDAKNILKGLGGKENIKSLDSCITRLRLEVNDPNKVDADLLKKDTGASNVIIDGSKVHVVYGIKIDIIRKAVDIEMENN